MLADRFPVSRAVVMKSRPVWDEEGWSKGSRWVGLSELFILREKEEICLICFVNIKYADASSIELFSTKHLREIRDMKITSYQKERIGSSNPILTVNS